MSSSRGHVLGDSCVGNIRKKGGAVWTDMDRFKSLHIAPSNLFVFLMNNGLKSGYVGFTVLRASFINKELGLLILVRLQKKFDPSFFSCAPWNRTFLSKFQPWLNLAFLSFLRYHGMCSYRYHLRLSCVPSHQRIRVQSVTPLCNNPVSYMRWLETR